MNNYVLLAVAVWFVNGLIIGFFFGRASAPWDEIRKAAADARMRLFTGPRP